MLKCSAANCRILIIGISKPNKKAQLTQGLRTYARQRRHSKMAVSRHLGFYGTANSAIRSVDPENPNLEPNMEWIGCTVCEISMPLNYTVTLKLGFGVTQGHRKWHYSIEHIRLYIRLP